MAVIMDRNASEDIWSAAVPGGRLRVRLLQPTARRAERSPAPVFLHEAPGGIALWRDFPQRLVEATGALPAAVFPERIAATVTMAAHVFVEETTMLAAIARFAGVR